VIPQLSRMIEGGAHFTVRVSVYNLTSLKLSFAKNPIPQNPARTSGVTFARA
jgi:hypothetical protein